jgi:Spy/CpxP family protein refolding chaperone
MMKKAMMTALIAMMCGAVVAWGQGDREGGGRERGRKGGDKEGRERGSEQGRPQRGGERGGPQHGGERKSMIERMLGNEKAVEHLQLTEEQVASLKSGSGQLTAEAKKLQAAMQAKAEEQVGLLGAGEIDKAAVMAVIEEIGRLRTEMGKIRVRELLLIQNTLTDEQGETMKRMRNRMQRGRGEGGPARRRGEGDEGSMQDGDREGGPDKEMMKERMKKRREEMGRRRKEREERREAEGDKDEG